MTYYPHNLKLNIYSRKDHTFQSMNTNLSPTKILQTSLKITIKTHPYTADS